MIYQAIKKLQDISKIWLTFALICINPPRTRRTFTHNLMAGGYFPCTVIPSDIVYINDLLNELDMCNPNFGIPHVSTSNPAFADDITCLNNTPRGLQNMMHCCFIYSCKWRFEFNAKKSAVVIFSLNQRIVNIYKWYLGNEEIPLEDKIVHLGIHLNAKLSLSARIENA